MIRDAMAHGSVNFGPNCLHTGNIRSPVYRWYVCKAKFCFYSYHVWHEDISKPHHHLQDSTGRSIARTRVQGKVGRQKESKTGGAQQSQNFCLARTPCEHEKRPTGAATMQKKASIVSERCMLSEHAAARVRRQSTECPCTSSRPAHPDPC